MSNLKLEEICEVCSDINPVWYAPNPLWNKVMRHPDGKEASEVIRFICPNCFIKMAARLGFSPLYELKESEL